MFNINAVYVEHIFLSAKYVLVSDARTSKLKETAVTP